MNINHRGPDWPPIYFDPDFAELMRLTKCFDTLRIGTHIEKGRHHLVIASGYGSSHSSLSRALGEFKYEGLNGGTSILYIEDNAVWFSLDEVGEKLRPEEALRYYKEPSHTLLKEIVKLVREREV